MQCTFPFIWSSHFHLYACRAHFHYACSAHFHLNADYFLTTTTQAPPLPVLRLATSLHEFSLLSYASTRLRYPSPSYPPTANSFSPSSHTPILYSVPSYGQAAHHGPGVRGRVVSLHAVEPGLSGIARCRGVVAAHRVQTSVNNPNANPATSPMPVLLQ